LTTPRNAPLDGWRAIAVLGVMWLHWSIPAWRGPIPFEIGLYFFLTLTGFLITRILLRERDAGEASGKPWRLAALKRFQWRRALRILVPCYAAMIFGLAVGADDLRQHPLVYFAQVSNFHLATLPAWPEGTAHYWTLAIQQQFYLLWPLLVFGLPRRALAPAFVIAVGMAPLSRLVLLHHFPEIPNPGAITSSALDFLGGGSLLALALHRGLDPGDPRLRAPVWTAFALYLVLYSFDIQGHPLPGLRHFQQTLLTVAMVGLVAATLAGLPAPVARVLAWRPLQHVARISYSLYLLHNLVPLALGWVLPALWWIDGPPGTALRLAVFALASWGLSWLSWRWIEQPMERLRGSRRPDGREIERLGN
jgi:peptidoglycan/LPS O-acetylase OafA/YrhL